MCRIHETHPAASREERTSAHDERLDLARAGRPNRGARGTTAPWRHIGRIGDDEVRSSAQVAYEIGVADHVGVARECAREEAVFIDISGTQGEKGCVLVDERHVGCRSLVEEREAYGSDPRAEIDRTARETAFARREPGEVESVDVDAVAFTTRGLPQTNPSFVECVEDLFFCHAAAVDVRRTTSASACGRGD